MEWTEIIAVLGGGPMAVMVVGITFWGLQERKAHLAALDRLDALYERLITKTDEHLVDSIKRETETLNTLNQIAATIRGSRYE